MIDRPDQQIAEVALSLLLVLSVLMSSGCGEIAFKRGAGGDALQADQAACRAQGDDLGACMKARGWILFNPGSTILAVGSSEAPASPASTAEENEGAPVLMVTTVKQDNRDSSPPPPLPKLAPKPYDPLARYAVSSWWKRGGGHDDLEAATRLCSDKLGAKHTLEQHKDGGQTVTAALVRCLRDYGWYGLGIPNS